MYVRIVSFWTYKNTHITTSSLGGTARRHLIIEHAERDHWLVQQRVVRDHVSTSMKLRHINQSISCSNRPGTETIPVNPTSYIPAMQSRNPLHMCQ